MPSRPTNPRRTRRRRRTDGGAVYALGSHAKFYYCNFQNNGATRYGGAIFLSPGELTFDHCTFAGSYACGPLGSQDVLVLSLGALPPNIFHVTATDFTVSQWDGQDPP